MVLKFRIPASRLGPALAGAVAVLALTAASARADSDAVGKAGSITLDIGTASGGLGDVVTVPVALTTNGETPATILFNVLYNPDVLTYASVAPGAAATAAQKQVDDDLGGGAGKVGLAIWGANLEVIGDGLLMTLSFEITGGQVGDQATLTGSNASAASPGDGINWPEFIAVTIETGQIQVAEAGEGEGEGEGEGGPTPIGCPGGVLGGKRAGGPNGNGLVMASLAAVLALTDIRRRRAFRGR